jgi:hypothetical protein
MFLRRAITRSFGTPKFGSDPYDAVTDGRRVDLFWRTIDGSKKDRVVALQGWLKGSSTSARCLRRKAVVLLDPHLTAVDWFGYSPGLSLRKSATGGLLRARSMGSIFAKVPITPTAVGIQVGGIYFDAPADISEAVDPLAPRQHPPRRFDGPADGRPQRVRPVRSTNRTRSR